MNNYPIHTSCIFLLLCLCYTGVISGQQQLCEGNLGANIFTDGDFGSGADNVIRIDPNIAPGYSYSNSPSAPNDGFYTITNNIRLWNFNFATWLEIGDNSNDPQGYMMVINASFEPGLFYSQQVDGLCENTLYEFSADIINLIRIPVSNHIEPNIDFLLDNVVRSSSGDVPQDAEWHRYGFTFTTAPGQTSMLLSLRNNAPGGIGNDLALDNISFRACGPDAFVTAADTLFLCQDENMPQLIEAELSAQNQAIQWQFSLDSIVWNDIIGANSDRIFHDQFEVGSYYYRYISAGSDTELLNEKCRIISDVLTVEVLPDEHLLDRTICAGETFGLGNRELATSGNYMESLVSSRGCDSIVFLNLTILDMEQLDLETELQDPLCNGSSDGFIRAEVLNNDFAPYTYAINEVTTTDPLFLGLSRGDYTITITNNIGCEQEFMFTLDEPERFVISLPRDTTISLGETLDISVMANQVIDSLEWSPSEFSPCGGCTEFTTTPLRSGTVSATAWNPAGCQARDEFNIMVDISDLNIYFPNVFEPSLPGVDASYTIGAKEGLISNIISFSVYDRWGNIIHKVENTTDLALWDGRSDGRPVNPGVYVYLVVLELIDGQQYTFVDNLTLLR